MVLSTLYALFVRIHGEWRFEGLSGLTPEQLVNYISAVEGENGPGTAHVVKIELPE